MEEDREISVINTEDKPPSFGNTLSTFLVLSSLLPVAVLEP